MPGRTKLERAGVDPLKPEQDEDWGGWEHPAVTKEMLQYLSARQGVAESWVRGVQKVHKKWEDHNFGHRQERLELRYQALMGIGEEYGELLHAVLKSTQGIRSDQQHQVAIKDAIGDIFLYMLAFCNREGIDFFNTMMETLDEVWARDWVRFPVNGRDK